MGVYGGPERNVSIQSASGRSLYSSGVVQNGLVLNLDAGKFYSYPRSGTTWTDLTNNNNTATLTNGPTYSSANSGSIVFDGVDDFIDFTSDSNLLPTAGLTVSAWFKTTVADRLLLMKSSGTGGTDGYTFIGSGTGNINFFVNNIIVFTPSAITTGVWINIVATWTPSTSLLMYQNGTQVASNTTSIPASITNPSTNLEIARRIGTGDYWNGNISQVSIYNRALTAQEVQQNFNATRSRYGI